MLTTILQPSLRTDQQPTPELEEARDKLLGKLGECREILRELKSFLAGMSMPELERVQRWLRELPDRHDIVESGPEDASRAAWREQAQSLVDEMDELEKGLESTRQTLFTNHPGGRRLHMLTEEGRFRSSREVATFYMWTLDILAGWEEDAGTLFLPPPTGGRSRFALKQEARLKAIESGLVGMKRRVVSSHVAPEGGPSSQADRLSEVNDLIQALHAAKARLGEWDTTCRGLVESTTRCVHEGIRTSYCALDQQTRDVTVAGLARSPRWLNRFLRTFPPPERRDILRRFCVEGDGLTRLIQFTTHTRLHSPVIHASPAFLPQGLAENEGMDTVFEDEEFLRLVLEQGSRSPQVLSRSLYLLATASSIANWAVSWTRVLEEDPELADALREAVLRLPDALAAHSPAHLVDILRMDREIQRRWSTWKDDWLDPSVEGPPTVLEEMVQAISLSHIEKMCEAATDPTPNTIWMEAADRRELIDLAAEHLRQPEDRASPLAPFRRTGDVELAGVDSAVMRLISHRIKELLSVPESQQAAAASTEVEELARALEAGLSRTPDVRFDAKVVLGILMNAGGHPDAWTLAFHELVPRTDLPESVLMEDGLRANDQRRQGPA